MAYPEFHRHHPELKGGQPVFHDTDGSPVYESPYQGLLCSIINRNDTSALRLYNDCPHSSIFLQAYDAAYYNPFSTTLGCHSYDVLSTLIQIYLSDTSLTEPLEKYLKRFYVSLVHEACSAADQDLVLLLINHNPPLGTLRDRSFRDRTPLLCAAEALGEVGGLMVDAKAGESLPVARQKAREHRDRIEDFIYWLLRSGCSVSESDAFEQDYKHDKDPEKALTLTGTVLGAAIPYATQAMVLHLIAIGADVHARQVWYGVHTGMTSGGGVTPLHIAASYWNLEAMQALINLRSNAEISEMVSVADDEGRLPLHWALHGTADRREEKDNSEIVSRMAETVETLLNIRPDTINARDRQGATTFHYAVDTSLGFVAVSQAIEPLLSAKPSPEILNTRNGRGSTALGEAARPFTLFGGNLNQLADLVKTLITNGADARLCADKGRSFLHVLSNYSWAQDIPPALLDFLLETVDVNQADADGCTALHYLVKNLDQSDAILHLLSRGADVSAVDRKGNTPLHEVMKGKMLRKVYANREVEPLAPNLLRRTRDELILALLNAGASMDQTNIAGQTPKQVLDCVLEEREGQKQREAAKRAKWGEDPIVRQDRGRVVAYVNSGS